MMPARAASTPLVTGNGHGFAVVTTRGNVSGYFAHPYKFEKADPKDPLAEGIETADFIKNMAWKNSNRDHRKSSSSVRVEYKRESQIITIERASRKQTVFMPFGLEVNVLIVSISQSASTEASDYLEVEWEHPVKSEEQVHIGGHTVRVFEFEGVNETLAMVPVSMTKSREEENRTHPMLPNTADLSKGRFLGTHEWAFISVESKEQLARAVDRFDRWAAGLSCSALVERELKQVEAWRKKPAIHFASEKEQRLWRQSEMVLRMAQCKESNRENRHNHGLIIASLPDGAWFVPWVRDMAYAVLALNRMGHKDEAAWALKAYLNAQPSSKMQKDLHDIPYQVSVVRYFGDGDEAPFFTMEGANNIELDNWGLVLWTLGDYWSRHHDRSLLESKTYRGSVYENAKEFVAKPLIANLEAHEKGLIVRADTSIWEERQKDAKHFAYSTIMAIRGLKSFDTIAQAMGDREFHQELQTKIAQLEQGFRAAYVRSGHLRGTLEPGIKNEVDGATLSAISLGIVKDRAVIEQSVKDMQKLKMASGGYRRVTSIVTDPKIFEYWYERQEFLFIDFLLAEVYLKLGMPDKAAALIAPIVEKSARDHNHIPEMYVSIPNYRFVGRVGEPTGAIPMVGYGAGVFELFMLLREKRQEQDFF